MSRGTPSLNETAAAETARLRRERAHLDSELRRLGVQAKKSKDEAAEARRAIAEVETRTFLATVSDRFGMEAREKFTKLYRTLKEGSAISAEDLASFVRSLPRVGRS